MAFLLIAVSCLTVLTACAGTSTPIATSPVISATSIISPSTLAMPGKLVNVGGYRLHLNCTGQGRPTVILETGLRDFSLIWPLVQPKVAQTYRVCSYDRAGYGWSDVSPQPRHATQIARELNTLLDKAGEHGPYVLVGHSVGGLVVQMFAAQYPALVAGMVLVDSTALATTDSKLTKTELAELAKAPANSGEANEEIDPTKLPAEIRSILPIYQAFQAKAQSNGTIEQEMGQIATGIGQVRAAKLNLGSKPLRVLVASVSTQFYYQTQTLDRYQQILMRAFTELGRDYTAMSSNSRLIIANKSGHYIHIDRPDLVIQAINEVCQQS